MKKTSLALSALVLALAFTSCVSSPKTNETEKEPQKEQQSEIKQTEEKKEDKKEDKAEKEWSNSAWKVVGKNGSENIETASPLLVDSSKDIEIKVLIQSEQRMSILLSGVAEKRVNTWSTSFSVSVQDSFGIEFILNEAMRDGKLFLNKDNSELITELFVSGGDLVFLLTKEENPAEQYSFAVPNQTKHSVKLSQNLNLGT